MYQTLVCTRPCAGHSTATISLNLPHKSEVVGSTHFTDGKSETQRGEATCPRPCSLWVGVASPDANLPRSGFGRGEWQGDD